MIELPGWLEWLEPIVGMEWPEGNEDQMWALAQDWHTAADELRAVLFDIDAAKSASLTAYPVGEGVEEMIKGFDSMRSGDGSDQDQSVQKLAELFDQIGESAHSVGTEIEYAKLMYWSSLGLLAAELAAAWLFPPTAPAVQAAAIGITRVAVRIIGQRVVAAIIRHVGKLVASKFAKFMLRHVAIDTVLGTLQELGVQQWQVSQGNRKEINWEQVAVTAVSSAAGGAAAGPFGDWLGNKLSAEMKPWMRAAITGPAAGLAGAGAGFVAATATQFGIDAAKNGWGDAWDNLKNTQVDWRMFTAGASNGAMSAVNKVGAQHAWGSMRPEMFSRSSFGSRFEDVFNTAGSDGSSSNDGARVGLRPDGAGLPAGAGDGSGRGTSGDDGRAGAGSDGRGAGGGDGRGSAGDNGRGAAGDDTTRPAGTSDADGRSTGGDAGARQTGADAANGRDSGEATGATDRSGDGGGSTDEAVSNNAADRSSGNTSRGEDRAAGDQTSDTRSTGESQTRAGDSSTRSIYGAPAGADHIAAQSDSAGAGTQRAGAAPEADAVRGAGSDGLIDAASTNNDPVSVHHNVGDGLAATTPAHTAPTANPGSTPAQPTTANPVGGESRSTPASSTTPRTASPDVRVQTGSDTPRVDQPRTQTGMEPRAGAPDSRAAGEPRPVGDRPRAGDLRADGTDSGTESSRTGLADTAAHGTDRQSALQSESTGAQPPRIRAGVDGSAPVRQTVDPESVVPTDGPQPRDAGDPSAVDAIGLLPLAAPAGAEASPRSDRTAHPETVARTDDHSAAAQPDPANTDHPRDCAVRSLELIRRITGSPVIEPPTGEVGPDGVSQDKIEQAAQAPLRDVADHNAIRDALMYETRPDGSLILDSDGNPIERPDGVAALVVDVYGKTDEHNVGAHAYVLVKENGEIVVHDPASGLRHPFPPILPGSDYPVQLTRTILFDENGIPQQRDDAEVPSREPALRNVDVGQRPPEPDGEPVEPASGSNGGARKPPIEPPASPGDPGDDSSSKPKHDNDSGGPPVLEPDSVVLADDAHPLTLDINGEPVPLALHPDGEDRWRAVPADEGDSPAQREGSGEVEKKSRVRNAWERFRDRTYVRGYQGDNPKYPSGSGEDGRGQTALRDGAVAAPDLFDPPPPAPAPTPPPNPDLPTMG
ncbi:hypothetical protein, partial [Nocardia ninae]